MAEPAMPACPHCPAFGAPLVVVGADDVRPTWTCDQWGRPPEEEGDG